jgi:hypothetical protein
MSWLPAQPGVNFKRLESLRGFLVQMQRTYPALTPYLKGIHLTLDSWPPGRNTERWKDKAYTDENSYWDVNEGTCIPWEEAITTAPTVVQPVPRYAKDLDALAELLAGDTPPLHYLRQQKVHVALYGFVDASGQGYGSSIEHRGGGVTYTYNIWGPDEESHTLNFRELHNRTKKMEAYIVEGILQGAEVLS